MRAGIFYKIQKERYGNHNNNEQFFFKRKYIYLFLIRPYNNNLIFSIQMHFMYIYLVMVVFVGITNYL